MSLTVIATDISNIKKVIFDKGPEVQAGMASTYIPGVFSPAEFDEKFLVDGGIAEIPFSFAIIGIYFLGALTGGILFSVLKKITRLNKKTNSCRKFV